MVMAQPHFLLFCNTHLKSRAPDEGQQCRARTGRWHFVLEQLDGVQRLEAADSESAVNQERLALLSVVRGLEALEQPSRVTLVTTSRYVSRGLRYGLSTWRNADYKWERFGVQMPIRNADLWQRINGAMGFHGVTCRLVQSEIDNPEHASATDGLSTANVVATAFSPAVAIPADVTEEISLTIGDYSAAVREIPELRSSSEIGEIQPSNAVLPLAWKKLWWKLAAGWIRWWRGRPRLKPAFYGM